jgi:hypothetical protein
MLPSDMSCQIMRSCIGTVTKMAVMHIGKAPKYEIRNLLFKTFHLIYYMTTFLKLNLFALVDLCPTPAEGHQHIKFTSRHASFCRTSIWWHNTSGHVSVTLLHLPVREVLWGGAIVQNPGCSTISNAYLFLLQLFHQPYIKIYFCVNTNFVLVFYFLLFVSI